jgi:putative nucleotidyltransferase with HDIG domain
VWSLLPHLAFLIFVWFGSALLIGSPPSEYPGGIIAVVVNCVLTLLLLFAVSPVLELIFGYTTRFRLMELMNLEQPLLQELMLAMPGTYHHSLLVANLVEAGAKAVGANSLLCKVAALFHDIGKISYPEYFIENQFGGENKHDKLVPSMSALVLVSHVKKGVELAQSNKLGWEVSAIIGQHHGTRLMTFFYQKAVDAGENPRREDYCYPGPRPQSREAAIVMLADVVEASSRTLSDPTPARITGHIDKIVKGIFAEGQLDESELTFKDLYKLSASFRRILISLFHQRIAYPELKEKNGSAASEQKEANRHAPPQPAPARAD